MVDDEDERERKEPNSHHCKESVVILQRIRSTFDRRHLRIFLLNGSARINRMFLPFNHFPNGRHFGSASTAGTRTHRDR